MDMAGPAATRLTANAEALAAFYETRDVLRRAGARGELERPQRRYDPQPRWAAQAQYFSGLYREVRCLAPRGDDEGDRGGRVLDDGCGAARLLHRRGAFAHRGAAATTDHLRRIFL